MANIEFFTGFEGCGVVGDALSLFDGANNSGNFTFSSSKGFDSSKALTSGGYSRWLTKTISPKKTVVSGLHVSGVIVITQYSTDYALITFAGPDIRIVNYAVGDLRVYRGTTAIATGLPNITSAMTHLEVKMFSSATVGTVQIKVNGTLIADLSGLNTGGADVTAVMWSPFNKYIDNIFIADDWMGELKAQLLKPSFDVSKAFTPSTGTDNYAMIATNDGDTTTVSASASGTKDLYGYEDLPAGLTVKSVTIVTVAKKDDVGTVVLNVLAKQDSAEYEVASQGLATDYPSGVGSALQKILSTQPDGTPWGDSGTFNDIYWGFGVD